MNSVSVHVVLTRKISLNALFVFFCLLFLQVSVSIIRLEQYIANTSGLHFPLYLFSILEVSLRKLSPLSSERVPMIQEYIQIGMQKMKSQ
jgi:hypothetical protein